ncbi:MAG: MFS transporter [Solirubrobacterales bacterium]|nr:MFS transporter [Solirubrobacterales bacterium]MBV9165700.1 MFS transporter [Solirubrobacterales bacterium]
MTDRILAQRHRLITEENSRWWTLGAMCFALFMLMLDNTVVNIALPSIQHDLHASLSALLWTVNAYTLTFAVLLVTGGRLGDIFGRRRMFLFGVVVFGVASLAIGFAPNDTVLVTFRAVQGIGAAFMMPATLSIITQTFPPHQRGMAIGTWAGVSALALAIGPVIGGFLTEAVSWRAIFFINPPIAVIAIAVTLFATRESRDETVGREVDFPGIAALTVGLTALVLALIESNNWHWGSARVIGLLALSAIALAAFIVIERLVRAPMVDFAFFRSRTSAGANLVGFLVTFGMFAQFFFITLYLQNVLHYSALQTGLRFLPATVVIIIMGPLAGRLTDKVGPRSLMTAGLLIVAGAMLIQSRLTIHTGYGLLLPGFILMGLGMGLVMSPMSTAAMNAVDRTKAGAASGVLSMSRMVGGSVGLAAMGALVTAVSTSKITTALPQLPASTRARIVSALGSGAAPSGAHHAPPEVVATIHSAFISALAIGLEVGAVVMVAGAVLAWMLIERSPARTRPEAVAEPEPETHEQPAEATLVS